MEKIKTKESEEETLRITILKFKGACLYLRRSIFKLSASTAKERLLFYIDNLINLDIVSRLDDAQAMITTMCSMVKNINITHETRHHLAYLNDICIALTKPIKSISKEMV